MENDVMEALRDVGYMGPMLEEGHLEKALSGGAKSIEYTTLVEWLGSELKSYCDLEEHINSITTPDDSSSFVLEVSSFLKELGCSYSCLTEGHLSDRLNTHYSRCLLLDYMLTELLAARMIRVNKPDSKNLEVRVENQQEDPYDLDDELDNVFSLISQVTYIDIFNSLVDPKCFYTSVQFKAYKTLESHTQFTCGWLQEVLAKKYNEITLIKAKSESNTASDLTALLIALQFPKPPAQITPGVLFNKVENKLKEVLSKASPELIGTPLFTGHLSPTQWQQLDEVQSELQQEYHIRRQMLIKRLDVTVQSFQWSERMQQQEDKIATIFRPRRQAMKLEPSVKLADLLAAREDLAILEKTSSAMVRRNTQSSVNKVIIGNVPDRGGRPSEQQPPPPEMPSWEKQRQQGGGRGGYDRGRGGHDRGRGGHDRGRGGHDRGRGGHDRGRGGRVQGNWNQGLQQDNRQGGSSQDRGGYLGQGGRGYYNDGRGGYRGGYGNSGGYQQR